MYSYANTSLSERNGDVFDRNDSENNNSATSKLFTFFTVTRTTIIFMIESTKDTESLAPKKRTTRV